jgi:hypothetical protein
MVKGRDVLEMLIPTGSWVITENDYDSIQWLDCEPLTKAEFEAGFAQYDAWKAEQDATKAATKAALLARLGITAEEAQLLLGGN